MKTVGLMFALALAVLAISASAANVATDFLVSCPKIENYSKPQVGIDKKGVSVVVWVSGTTILGRRFNADGFAMTAPFTVFTGPEVIYDLLLAVSDSGHFVVGWIDGVNSPHGFYIKRYNRDGSYFDYTPRTVHTDVDWNSSKLSINNVGDCAYACKHNTTSVQLVYGRILLSSDAEIALPTGSIGDNWPYIAINDHKRVAYVIGNYNDGIWHRSGTYSSGLTWNDAGAYATGNTYNRSSKNIDLDMAQNGDYWIAWRGASFDTTEILCRRYNATGVPYAGAMTVSKSQPWAPDDETISIDVGSTGYAVIKWSAPRSWTAFVGDDVPWMCLYSPMGTARTGTLPVFNNAASKNVKFYTTHIAIDSSGAPIAVGNVEYLVLMQRYTNNGGVDGPELMANLGSSAANPAVAFGNKQGVAAAAWETTSNGQIAVKKFLNRNSYLGQMISPVNSSGVGHYPAIALSNDTVSVAWQDMRDGETDPSIYVQLLNNDMVPVGANRRLSDLGAKGTSPAIAAGASRYFVAWQDVRSANGTTSHIYGQLLTKTGTASGGNFQISAATSGGTAPVVVSNGKNSFAVIWAKATGSFPSLFSSVFAQRYNGSGVAVGDTIRISNGYNPAAAMDTAGNFGVVWTTNIGQVYCCVIGWRGNDAINTFRVDTGTAGQKTNVSIGMNAKGAFVVAWRALQGEIISVESRTFNADGTPQGTVRAHSDALVRHKVPLPMVAAGDTTALLVWVNSFCVDTTQRDVWGEFTSIVDHSSTSVGKPLCNGTASLQNSNMPGMTQIYNIRGQHLATVQTGKAIPSLPHGFYFVRTGTGVASKTYKTLIVNGKVSRGLK